MTSPVLADPTGPPPPCGAAAPPCRRAVLRGAAALGALGLTSALAGCGGGSTGAVAAGDAAGPPTDSGRGEPVELGPAAAIPVGGGKIFKDQKVVVTQPTKGEFRAFTAVCTHTGCLVGEVTKTIDCFCHGSSYSITDGSVVSPPAPAPLAAKQITVTGGTISVRT